MSTKSALDSLDTISRGVNGLVLQRAPFNYKGRLYVAVRYNLGKCEVYVTGASGLEHFVGYACDVSEPLAGAALLALDHTDRILACMGM